MKTHRRPRGQLTFKGKAISFYFWSNVFNGQKPDTIILLGAGQTDAIARMVAKRAGLGVVVVGGVPHWHASADGRDTGEFTKRYFYSAYEQALAVFGARSMHIWPIHRLHRPQSLLLVI